MIHTKESDAILKENQIDSDPVLQFINNMIVAIAGGYKFQDDTYEVYKQWFKITGQEKKNLNHS